jgi:hypothetical protein
MLTYGPSIPKYIFTYLHNAYKGLRVLRVADFRDPHPSLKTYFPDLDFRRRVAKHRKARRLV